MRSQPLDFDAHTIKIVDEPIMGLVWRAVPIDDAAIALSFQHRVREEMLQRLPQKRLVKADNSRNRAGRSVATGLQGLLRNLRAMIETQGPGLGVYHNPLTLFCLAERL